MDGSVFGEEEVAFLRGCIFDPTASCSTELLSGAVHWYDERFMAFAALSRRRGRNFAKHLFAYRTALLVGQPREELRFVWDAARAACPVWIGFRSERTTADPSYWPAWLKAELDAY